MKNVKGVRLTDSQYDVYSVIDAYDPIPDHALVPLVQHAAAHQSSSGIRTRRAELVRKGLVQPAGKVKMPSGRFATTFATN